MVSTLEPSSPDAVVCVHHWLIASPRGEHCIGKCKRCGVSRDFSTTDPQRAFVPRRGPRKV